MPSAEGAGSTGQSLARRLAWVLAMSAASAAAVALFTASLLADQLIIGEVQRATADAAAVLAAELDEEPSLAAQLEEEARELGIEMRVAVVPVAGGTSCVDDDATQELVCKQALRSDPALAVVVAAPAERVYGHRGPFALAAATVLAFVIVAAALLGAVLARRLAAPVQRLRQAVVDVDASAPTSVHLPPPTGLDELDGLRSALASLLERLDAELRRSRTFAANAAHELRTPLTKIRAELELASEGPNSDVPATLARLQRTTAHLELLTQRLLLLATPHEALDGGAEATSMSALAEALLEARDPAEGQRLRVEVADTDGLVRGDPVLLAAVLDNAVDNALKFSDDVVTVSVSEDRAGARVLVDIDDRGPGVTKETAAAMFEPFARAAGARNRAGHGLGLSLCRHVTRAYGGTVEFVGGRQQGARFRIALPLVE